MILWSRLSFAAHDRICFLAITSPVTYWQFVLWEDGNIKTTFKNKLKCRLTLKATAKLNVKQLHFIPTECIFIFFKDIGTNSNYFPIRD